MGVEIAGSLTDSETNAIEDDEISLFRSSRLIIWFPFLIAITIVSAEA